MSGHGADHSTKREEELESVIENSRQTFTETLAEIQHEANLKTQANYVKDNLLHKVQEVRASALNVLDQARAGDPEAKKKLAITLGSTTAFIVLRSICKKIKKRHR